MQRTRATALPSCRVALALAADAWRYTANPCPEGSIQVRLMSKQELVKDESIHDLLARLKRALRGREFQVVDHWEASLCAIGVASPQEKRALAYISTFDKPPGYYFLSLELPPPPGSGRSYVPAGEYEHVDFKGLARLIKRHLDPKRWKSGSNEGWGMEAGSAVSKARDITSG
jgi:hypothetical protein